MKSLTQFIIVGALGLSSTAFAADRFADVKRDVRVMGQILRGALKSQHRRGPVIDVDGSYLADQGAVFSIHSRGIFGTYSLHVDGGDGDSDNVVLIDGEPGPSPVPPDPATGMSIGGIGEYARSVAMNTLATFGIDGDGSLIDRQTRDALRDVSHQRQDLDQQISDARMQLLHADKDADRKALEAQIAKLEKRRDAVDAEQEKLRRKIEDAAKAHLEKRKAMREKVRQARRAEIAKAQQAVLESLCEYGSTLKHLPDNEHVSVIFDGMPGDESHEVYVMSKKDVTGCSAEHVMVKAAQKYSY